MRNIKEKLQKNELVVGTMISEVRNPNIANMLAQCGFDFFIIDSEHGAYDYETMANILAAAAGAGLSVIVRIPEIRRETIMKPLDLGAAGLLVPMVNTASEAREVVSHAKYPPAGKRGVALRRPHSSYARVNAAEYLEKANDTTFIAVQAETADAVENIEEIASVEGVDCVFVGPFDLSVSLGIPGQLDHPDEIKAIEKVLAACRTHNKISGILMFDQAMLTEWIGKGVRFAAYSSDISMLADAAARSVKDLKNMNSR